MTKSVSNQTAKHAETGLDCIQKTQSPTFHFPCLPECVKPNCYKCKQDRRLIQRTPKPQQTSHVYSQMCPSSGLSWDGSRPCVLFSFSNQKLFWFDTVVYLWLLLWECRSLAWWWCYLRCSALADGWPLVLPPIGKEWKQWSYQMQGVYFLGRSSSESKFGPSPDDDGGVRIHQDDDQACNGMEALILMMVMASFL